MTSKIIIAADQKAKRISYKESLSRIRPESELILVKSFQEILDYITNSKISMILLDSKVDDSPNHRTRQDAIKELKEKSNNTPIVLVGTERSQALKSLKDGADGFIPMGWFS